MTKSEALDFPFVDALPKREKGRFQKVWDHFQAIQRLVESTGMLIPSKLAADIAGISQQRIDQLMDAKVLEKVYYHGHPFVTQDSFLSWAKSERKAGRPLKTPGTMGAKVKMAREFGRTFAAETAKQKSK